MNEKIKGYIAAILSTIIVGFSFIFVKIALITGNPLDILAHRFTFAFITILPVAIFKKEISYFTKRNLFKILPIVFLYPVIFFSLQIYGLYFIPSAEAGIIQSTSPIFIMIFAVFLLKEKISTAQVIFTFISVFGVVFIFFMNGTQISNEHYFGLLLITLSVISLSLYSVLVRKNKNTISVFQMTFMVTFLGFVFFNILSIGQHILNPNMESILKPFTNIQYVTAILYLGVLSSLGTSFLTNYSYTKIEASRLGVFGNFVIVISIFGGVVILKERLMWQQVVGAILIFIGVVGTNIVSQNLRQKK